jgi:hypothetical protein
MNLSCRLRRVITLKPPLWITASSDILQFYRLESNFSTNSGLLGGRVLRISVTAEHQFFFTTPAGPVNIAVFTFGWINLNGL